MDLLAEDGTQLEVSALFGASHLRDRYSGQTSTPLDLLTSAARRVRAALRSKEFDLVWIEKEVLPFIPYFVEERMLGHVPYVVDLDDAVFHTYDLHRRLLVRLLLASKVDQLMGRAQAVVAGSRYLAERARNAGAKRVHVIPSSIRLAAYGPPRPLPTNPFTIGWIGSPTSEGRLELIRPALTEASESPNTQLVLVGATPAAVHGVSAIRHEWSEQTEVELLAAMSAGIMPLDDTPWRRGKCAFKIVQYLAAGRPAIASPVGANVDVIEDSHGGILASSNTEWINAIRALHNSPEWCIELGARGRQAVELRYSVEANAPRIHQIMNEAAGVC